MNITQINLSDIKPHPKNPNTHPTEQLNELQSSLTQFKQVKNIVVWQGYILAGHGLVSAAKQQKLTTLDAIDVSDWPEKKAISFMVADNRLPDLAAMDMPALSDLLASIDDPLDIPGIDDKFLSDLLSTTQDLFDMSGDNKMLEESYAIVVEGLTETSQMQLLAQLQKEGYQCKSVIS